MLGRCARGRNASGDTYVLNGFKHFITNAGIAHVNTVFAVTEPDENGHEEASAPSSSRGTAGIPHGQDREQDGHSRLADG